MLHKSLRQFGKFFVVQLAAYGIEWACFLLARFLGVGPLTGNVLAKVAAMCFAFMTHRAFTFRDHKGNVFAQVVRYLLGFAFNTSVSTYFFWALDQHLPEFAAKAISDTAIVLASFVIAKKLIFRSS